MKYPYTLTILAAMAALSATTAVSAVASTNARVVVAAETDAPPREIAIRYHNLDKDDLQHTFDGVAGSAQLQTGQSIADLSGVAAPTGFAIAAFLGYQEDDTTGVVTVQVFRQDLFSKLFIHFIDEDGKEVGTSTYEDQKSGRPTAPEHYEYVVSHDDMLQYEFIKGRLNLHVKLAANLDANQPTDDPKSGTPTETLDNGQESGEPVQSTGGTDTNVPSNPGDDEEKGDNPGEPTDSGNTVDNNQETATANQPTDDSNPDVPSEPLDQSQEPVQPTEEPAPESKPDSGDEDVPVAVATAKNQDDANTKPDTTDQMWPIEDTFFAERLTDVEQSDDVTTSDNQVLPTTSATVHGIVAISTAAVVHDGKFESTSRVLPRRSTWRSFGLVVAPDGEVYYDLGGSQFVAVRDARMTLAALNAGETDADFELSGVAVVDYVPHYGIQLWASDGKTAIKNEDGSKRKLGHDSEWQVFGVVTRSGRVYYDLGGGQLVDTAYISFK